MSAARVLIPPQSLQAAVRRLGVEISAARPDGVLLVAVLKGSVPFLADLARAVSVPVEVDFLAITSYAPDTGRVRLLKDLDTDIAGRHVVVVEDIVDTGLTLAYLLRELSLREPRSLEACALLDRAGRRIVPTPVRFVGFTVGDEYVVGYGMDFAERYRNLDLIAATDVRALRGDRDAHVADFYAR